MSSDPTLFNAPSFTPLRDDPKLAPLRGADPARPFVVAQLGQTLDGRIATVTGESRWINRDAALDHVHALRASVDAVVVGVGTAIADDPKLNVRRVVGPNPARVVLDPGGRLPPTAALLDGTDGARRIVVRTPEARTALPESVEVIEIARIDGQMPPLAVIAALYARGLVRLLIEGGAVTVSAFVDAGAVDRLHVLVAPMLLGSGKSGLSLTPIARLTEAIRPQTTVHVLGDGDVLFDCDLRSRI